MKKPIIHAVMEYADETREPLCGVIYEENVDAYEDDAQSTATCDGCKREMTSRGWDVLR